MLASRRRWSSIAASSSPWLALAAASLATIAVGCVPEGHDDPAPGVSPRGGDSGTRGAGSSSAFGAAGKSGNGGAASFGASPSGGTSSSGGAAGATAGAGGGTSAGAGAGGGTSAGAAGGAGASGVGGSGGTTAGKAGSTSSSGGGTGGSSSAGTGGSAAGGAGAPACTPQCGGKQCGNDGCNGSCGSCGEGATCNGSGQCEKPTPTTPCPVGPGDNLWSSYPDPWAEGQCIVQWSHNSAIMRAHYAEPGHVLYASQHETNGQVSFTSAAFLQNLGIGIVEAMKFCQEAPQNGTCVRQQAPNCEEYESKPSCTVLFNWSHNGTPVRLRRTGATLWAENQDPNGGWGFSSGSWMDAAGGFSNPHTGSLCFAAEKPGGEPEACP